MSAALWYAGSRSRSELSDRLNAGTPCARKAPLSAPKLTASERCTSCMSRGWPGSAMASGQPTAVPPRSRACTSQPGGKTRTPSGVRMGKAWIVGPGLPGQPSISRFRSARMRSRPAASRVATQARLPRSPRSSPSKRTTRTVCWSGVRARSAAAAIATPQPEASSSAPGLAATLSKCAERSISPAPRPGIIPWTANRAGSAPALPAGAGGRRGTARTSRSPARRRASSSSATALCCAGLPSGRGPRPASPAATS